MKRSASAVWQGGLKDGKGKLTTESAVLSDTPYSFSTRFESQHGTNPEELIGAAHVGCFSMALSGQLEKMGLHPETIQSNATVSLNRSGESWSVTDIHLDVSARVPGATEAQFTEAAQSAKANCPISRLLKARITLEARLMPEETGRRIA